LRRLVQIELFPIFFIEFSALFQKLRFPAKIALSKVIETRYFLSVNSAGLLALLLIEG